MGRLRPPPVTLLPDTCAPVRTLVKAQVESNKKQDVMS
jgi:hypothetical protein